MTTVPFKPSDQLGGLAECSGMLALERSSIVVEFQSKDALIGVLKSKIKRIEIPFDKIEVITLKNSLFGARIVLRVSDFELQSRVPSPGCGDIVFKIRRKYSLDATELVSAVQLGIADQKLKRIEEHFSS